MTGASVWLGEKRDLLSLTDAQNAELKRLRREYHAARPEFEQYRMAAIAKRHGVGAKWVSKKWRLMIERRAEQNYRRLAA